MLRICLLCLALAACASPHVARPDARERAQTERAEEAVQRMKDEFNQVSPNS